MVRSDLDGLTLLKGQVSIDATSGVTVKDGHIIEFESTGDATVTYEDDTTDVYTIPNAGTRVSLVNIKTVTFAGNISWS